jgi:DUF971 family protein
MGVTCPLLEVQRLNPLINVLLRGSFQKELWKENMAGQYCFIIGFSDSK